ncbi:MAG: LysM peptidoglycan-binding domain-containing protein [Rhodobacteraceae bacterium]|nr:LysM peptidoglycan-binding domain-containing protein [Paracoccaceae bacterium]
MALQSRAVTIAATSICITIASQPLMAQEYVVQPGDTIRSIAAEQLGSVSQWRFLCDLNTDLVPDCDLIYSGMTLRLSELTTTSPDGSDTATSETAAEPEPAESLPISNTLPAYDLSSAQVGVLGEDGQLPDGWRLSFAGGAGGTAVITAVTTEYVDITITQTGNTGAPVLAFQSPDGFIETRAGDVWRFSLEVALLSGNLADVAELRLRGSERGNNRDFLRTVVYQDDLALKPELRVFSGEAAIEHPDAGLMNPDFRIQSSEPWEAEFRIARPVLEKR